MIIAFDLDNTLIATRELHRKAYESVGVTPPDDWTGPWQDWLPQQVSEPERVHALKTAALIVIAQNHTPKILTPAVVYAYFRRHHDVIILTGASPSSVKLLWPAELLKPNLTVMGMTDDDKRDTLRGLKAVAFVDDEPLSDSPVPVVHWCGQTSGKLVEEVLRAIEGR